MIDRALSRTEMLIGKEGIEKLKKSRVAIFGIGGVGSYAVEGLARCGIGNIVLVDYDTIDITNINRQIHANYNTIGEFKVDAMEERILSINPDANIIKYNECVNVENLDKYISLDYDYVVDAIDMVNSKIELICKCKKLGIPIISAMGAGNKLDPTMFEVADIYSTSVCPLAKIMRKELKNRNIKNLKVVYSKEKPIKCSVKNGTQKSTVGSISFVPSVVGLIIAGEVIKDILRGGE